MKDARTVFDLVIIDCPPGLSVLTESWLREADFHISPTKADYVSVCGLEVFRRFKALNPEMGFAETSACSSTRRKPTILQTRIITPGFSKTPTTAASSRSSTAQRLSRTLPASTSPTGRTLRSIPAPSVTN